MSTVTVLTIDDEENILELLKYHLEKNGYNVVQALSGEEGLKKLEHFSIDLILLDVMLPGIDGHDVLRKIRGSKDYSDIPIIMLTAKNEEIDTVLGLSIGADDYMGKPFGSHELIARIKAVMRRTAKKNGNTPIDINAMEQEAEIIQIGEILINRNTHETFVKGMPIELSYKEFELLYFLIKNRGRVFGRDYLLEKIWGYDYFGETRTVDVHIRNVRKKIEVDDRNPEYIKTVRGVGYMFKNSTK